MYLNDGEIVSAYLNGQRTMPTQNILYPTHTVIPQNCSLISTALGTQNTLCQFAITDDPLVYWG